MNKKNELVGIMKDSSAKLRQNILKLDVISLDEDKKKEIELLMSDTIDRIHNVYIKKKPSKNRTANFKYIRSAQKDTTGKTIFSGQKVSVHGRINKRETVEVLFHPDYGFRIQGNNFADAYDIKIEKDISFINKLCGAFRFFFFVCAGK